MRARVYCQSARLIVVGCCFLGVLLCCFLFVVDCCFLGMLFLDSCLLFLVSFLGCCFVAFLVC